MTYAWITLFGLLSSFVIRALSFIYGLVVVVVVVSSCLITLGGWLNTTLRTSTLSPTSV